MASGLLPPVQQPAGPPNPSAEQYEALIEHRLRETRHQVTGVELAAGLIALAAGVLAFLLAAAVVDHWVIPGGLGFGGRLGLMVVLLAGAGWHFVRHVLPPLLYRINPLFAAHTIEQSRPTLKNSLINYLLLRGHREEVAPPVFRALQQRAAADLAQVSVETAVDRIRVIRLGYLLAGLLAVFCLYLILSPKSPLASAARIIWPWANVPAPTRVTIDDVQPGDAPVFLGEELPVSAVVRGLKDDEPVTLYFSTADGQIVDQPVPMALTAGEVRYRSTLPPGNVGLQQDITYYLAAGDDRTRRFKATVQIAPAINVESITYDYPAYTGIARQTMPRQGDVRALEGTQVTIHATANLDIQRAEIDLDCDGRHLVRMDVSGKTATGRCTLRLNKEDPPRAEHESYQLRFTDRQGRENRRPIRYHIEVTRDLAPEVRILEPQQEEVQLPVGSQLDIRVRAEDPDFALRRVALRAMLGTKAVPLPALLERSGSRPPHQGQFEGVYRFLPAKLGLKPGDHVEYWAEADDNKEPEPGHSQTEKRSITIVSGTGQQAGQDRQAKQGGPQENSGQPPDQAGPQPKRAQKPKAGEEGQPPGEKQAHDKQNPDQEKGASQAEGEPSKAQEGGQSKQPGEAAADKPGEGQSDGHKGQDGGKPESRKSGDEQKQSTEVAEKPTEPIDGTTNPGDAFDEILKHRQQQEKKEQKEQSSDRKPADEQPNDKAEQPEQEQKSGQQQSGDQQQSAQGKSGQQQSGKQQSGDKQKSDQQKSGEQQSGDQQSGDQQSGQQKSDGQQSASGQQQSGKQQKAGGQQQSGQQQSSGEQSGKQKQPSGKQKSGAQPSSDQQSGDQQSGDQQGGKEKSSEQSAGKQPPSGERQSGQQSSDQQQSGDQQAGDQQAGKEPSGKQSSEKRQPSGEQQSGKESSDQQPSGQQKSGQSESGQQKSGEKDAGQKESGQQSGEQPSAEKPKGGDAQPGQQKPDGGAQSSKEKQPAQEGGEQPSDQNQGGGQKSEAEKQPQAGGEGEKSEQSQSKSSKDGKGGGGEPQEQQKKSGGGGKSGNDSGSPAPQEGNQAKSEKSAQPQGQQQGEKEESAQSPSTSPKQSKSQGETSGDRSGGGKQGGGQQAPQPGAGTPGSQTDAQSGGEKSGQQGPGETGKNAGQQVAADHPTGKSSNQSGEGSGRDHQQGGDAAAKPRQQTDAAGGKPQQKPSDAGQAGDQTSQGTSSHGAGNPTNGGQPGATPGTATPTSTGPSHADDPNLQYARKATDLALDHLKDQLAKEKPDQSLLDRLGWTRDELAKFAERWAQMKRDAAGKGPQSETARKSLDEALKSLGLRRHGTELRGGQTARDRLQDLRDAGRFGAPAQWAEQFREYTRGVAGGGREAADGKR